MQEKKKQRRKHQPKGLIILHEDRDILVMDKAPGLLTMGKTENRGRKTGDSNVFLNRLSEVHKN